MGIVLFDWKYPSTTKKVVRPLFSSQSLFDGYLTESISCPHFAFWAGSNLATLRIPSNAQFSAILCFDCNLIKNKYSSKVGFEKIRQFFWDKIVEIINEL